MIRGKRLCPACDHWYNQRRRGRCPFCGEALRYLGETSHMRPVLGPEWVETPTRWTYIRPREDQQ